MSSPKQKGKTIKRKNTSPWRWVGTLFIMTVIISSVFSLVSNLVMDKAFLPIAIVVLFLIILIGIVFDIIGVAVTAADVQSIHGMASRRVKGALEAANLIKNANKVSSVCNDVIGDICGIISGSATAAIALQVLAIWPGPFYQKAIPIGFSALAAALTVSGKAIGKIYAIQNATQIIFGVGKFLSFFTRKPKKNQRCR